MYILSLHFYHFRLQHNTIQYIRSILICKLILRTSAPCPLGSPTNARRALWNLPWARALPFGTAHRCAPRPLESPTGARPALWNLLQPHALPFAIPHRRAPGALEFPTGARPAHLDSPTGARLKGPPRKQWTSSGALQGHAPHRRQTPGTQEVRFYLGGTRNCSMGHQIVRRLEPEKARFAVVHLSCLASSGALQGHAGHRGHTPGTQEVRFYSGERPIHHGALDWPPPGSYQSHFPFGGKS